jgi:hypothetical protein
MTNKEMAVALRSGRTGHHRAVEDQPRIGSRACIPRFSVALNLQPFPPWHRRRSHFSLDIVDDRTRMPSASIRPTALYDLCRSGAGSTSSVAMIVRDDHGSRKTSWTSASLAAKMRRSGADGCWGRVGHGPRIALLPLVFLIKGNDARKHTILLADPMKFVRVEIFCRESSHPECRSSQMGKITPL